MSTETPLNARQWLRSRQGSAWELKLLDGGPVTEEEIRAHYCEGYARAVLAEAETALRERAKGYGEKGRNVAKGYFTEAADLLAGMRR